MFTELLASLGPAAAGLSGGGGEPSKTSQQISNKATGNVVKSISVGNVKTTKKSKATGGNAGVGGGDEDGFSLTPVIVLTVMIFILVLVSIVALLGR